MAAITLLVAVVLDSILGEPRKYHPLVGFGLIVSGVENILYTNSSPRLQRLSGTVSWALLAVMPTLCLSYFLAHVEGWVHFFTNLLVLYLCIGHRSLTEHADAVATPLMADNLAIAREQVANIVSRDTSSLDEEGIAKAAVESILENGNDAVLATVFWFCIGGASAALLHRLANTLDARWGYRNKTYIHFGRASAYLDDALNWIPARMTALGYGITGSLMSALRCWRNQAPLAASPNAGPVMAAGAGALNIKLGGPYYHHGEKLNRPMLGCGNTVSPRDIDRALKLLNRAVILWLTIAIFILIARDAL